MIHNTVPDNVAFEVFIDTTNLAGGVSEAFLRGIDASLWASIGIMGIAAVLSWMRGMRSGNQDHRNYRSIPAV